MPLFDCAVGNFPYIELREREKNLKESKKYLDKILAKDWAADYRELFKKESQVKLSGLADIYAYLFFHTAKFIKPDGRMGFVTSNSWLDDEFGYELQKFFLKKFKLVAILESRCEPWFVDAAVNTVVAILERSDDPKVRDDHYVKFVKIKKPLAELIPWDMKIEWHKRWPGLNKLASKVEGAEQKAKPLADKIKSFEDDEFRIRLLKQRDLLEELAASGETVKWGKYLRAPDIYFEIMAKCRNKLAPLQELAELKRGFTTGINDFFYFDSERIKSWKIEKEFLLTVLRSPKESENILLAQKEFKFKVFYCDLSKAELRRQGKFGALKYIEWGEKQKDKNGVLFPKVRTVSGRKNWHSLPEISPAKILWIKSYNTRYLQLFSEKPVLSDQRQYLIKAKGGQDQLLAAILNSFFTALFIELAGRVNLGEGALDTSTGDANQLLMVNPASINKDLGRKMSELFGSLSKREIKPVFEEIKMKDRRRLDSLVLKALGLEPREPLDRIYEGLCELVKERIDLAKMRKKAKTNRVSRDIEKLKAEVLEDFQVQLSRKFPESFLDKTYLRPPEASELAISHSPLKLDRPFMNLHPLSAEDGFKYEAKSLEEAKFIIYSQAHRIKDHSYLVKIPRSQLILRKAVQDYEHHLKTVSQEMYQILFQRSADYKLAERMANEILEEFGIRLV